MSIRYIAQCPGQVAANGLADVVEFRAETLSRLVDQTRDVVAPQQKLSAFLGRRTVFRHLKCHSAPSRSWLEMRVA
jgi:hypothetical protein